MLVLGHTWLAPHLGGQWPSSESFALHLRWQEFLFENLSNVLLWSKLSCCPGLHHQAPGGWSRPPSPASLVRTLLRWCLPPILRCPCPFDLIISASVPLCLSLLWAGLPVVSIPSQIVVFGRTATRLWWWRADAGPVDKHPPGCSMGVICCRTWRTCLACQASSRWGCRREGSHTAKLWGALHPLSSPHIAALRGAYNSWTRLLK